MHHLRCTHELPVARNLPSWETTEMQVATVSIMVFHGFSQVISFVEATLRMPFGSRMVFPPNKVNPPIRATGSPWVFPTNDWRIIPHLTHVQTLKPPTSGNIRLTTIFANQDTKLVCAKSMYL